MISDSVCPILQSTIVSPLPAMACLRTADRHILEGTHECLNSLRYFLCSVDVSYEGPGTWSRHSAPKLLIRTTTRPSLVLLGAYTTGAIGFPAITSHTYRIYFSVLTHGNRIERRHDIL